MSKPKAKATVSKSKTKAPASKSKAKATASKNKTKAADQPDPDGIPNPKFTLTVLEPNVVTAVEGGLSWSAVKSSDGRWGVKVNGAEDLHKFFGDFHVNQQIPFFGANSGYYVFQLHQVIPVILNYCTQKLGKEVNIVILEGVEYHYFPELNHLEIIGTTDYTNCFLNKDARNAIYGTVLEALGFKNQSGYVTKFSHVECFIVWIRKLRTVRVRGAVEYILGDFLASVETDCEHNDGRHRHYFQWDVEKADFGDSQIKLIDRDCLSGLGNASLVRLPTSLISLVTPKARNLPTLLKQYEDKWNKEVEGYNPFGGSLPSKFYIDLHPNTGCCVIL